VALKEMYPGMINSPETTITNNINESDTIIYVLDPARVPEPPNLMTLGTGTNAETVRVIEINGNAITVERGFQGVPKAWPAGTVIARNFTEYDYRALKENIEDLEANKETPAGAQAKADAAEANAKEYTDQQVSAVSQALAAHKAETVSQEGGVHGLEVEEGTWTPYFYGTTVSGNNQYSRQLGRYIRIGKQVTAILSLELSSIDPNMSGSLRIGGLPYAVKNVAYLPNSGSIAQIKNITFGEGNIPGIFANDGHNFAVLSMIRNGQEPASISIGQLKNDSFVRATIIYLID